MTLRRPLVCITGTVQELPTGDTIAGAPEGGGSGGGMTPEQAMQLAFLVQNAKSSTLFTAPVISRVESFNFLDNNSLALYYFQYSTEVPGYRKGLYLFAESIDVNWGDGTSETLERVCEDYGNVSGGLDPNTGEYNPLHIFPGPGTYTLTFQGRNVYGLGNVLSYELTVSE